ncbi:hypothetical protein [Hyphomicrobium sp. CS1BSMeth3]|uniref:hypothetical protein n=1 Tax=Hyphomicrobium sp. CS1BSMeth3 TaxID=1892844 RepID=UPI0011600DB6|nr:hypothetical protein [Hyphomicrobium sp. CS1BSMeth3]
MAYAACASPAAPEGSLKYDSSTHKFRYCDDSNTWQALGGDVAAVNRFRGTEACAAESDHGRMIFGDAYIHVCTPYGWRTLGLGFTSPNPPDASWTGGYFVLVPSITKGNFGGRNGAKNICLSELASRNWKGKANAYMRGMLSSSKVRAFLCDGSTCENGQPSTSYRFALATVGGTASVGGDSFTTDGSGVGPGDNSDWSVATKFDMENRTEGYQWMYWTGRNAGTSTAWATTSHSVDVCSGWASTGGNGRVGSTGTGTSRWNSNYSSCNGNAGLVCFVDP